MPGSRILIVRLGAFGDIVHSLPLAADLHRAGLRVDWLCEDRWAVLLRGNPVVADVLELPAPAWRHDARPWADRLGAWRAVRKRLGRRRYHAVIDAQGLAKSSFWSLQAVCGRRVGHTRPRSREGSFLVTHRKAPCFAEHVIDQQRALALPLLGRRHPGGPWRFPLPSWPVAAAQAAAWLRERGLVRPWLVNVGAGWPTKVWPRERLAECCRRLVDDGEAVVAVWGDDSERETAAAILPDAPAAHLAPPTDIPHLAELLRRGGVLVSGDTGPLHLAMAVGCPTVGLFGPVPARRNGPRGPGHVNLQAPAAAWERHDPAKANLAAIAVGDVLVAGAGVRR